MDTKLSTNRKFNGTFANILSIFVILAVVFPAPTPAFALEPPRILASITNNWFEAEHFTPGASLSLEIYNALGGILLWGESRTADAWGFLFIGEWEHPLDLVPGNYITISDGDTTKDLVLEAVTLGVFDPSADYLAGTAPKSSEGRLVWVGTGNENYGCSMYATADPVSGAWTADFSAQPCDVTDDMWGAAQVFDADGDASEANPPPPSPNPRFVVFPEWEFFDGLDWPDGANVSISVIGKSECYLEKASWGGFFNGNFPEGCDVEIGDTVTFDDGTTNRRHLVRNLTITAVHPVDNTITGMANADTVVYVWPHESGFEPLQTTANEVNVWQVDLDDKGYDIREGSAGRSEIRDDMGNATAVDWYVPDPHFTVFPEWEFFDGLEWPDGAIVTIRVAGKSECSLQRASWGGFFNGNFPEDCDVVVGDEITFTDGITIRTHTVRNLAITKVDQADDIVKGVADVGADVYVWPHSTGQQQMAVANPRGKWEVDFTGIYDLMPSESGRAVIRDEMGNSTAVDWYIPRPRFTVYPDAQWLDGIDWPDGSTVAITVKGKPECTLTKESWEGFFNGAFPEGCVVTAGDKVTFTNGTITRKHTLQNLAISTVDKDANIVAGIADTGAVIQTWVWDLEGSNLEVTAVDGKWQADFGALGLELVEGMSIQAEIRDENGNATSVDLNVPDPRIVASITEDWFYLMDFLPGATLDLSIYESKNEGEPFWSGESTADVNGFAWIDAEGRWDLIPGNYLVVSDGSTTKDLEIEGFTFDVFDLTQGILQGTVPGQEGRPVWIGIGFENDDWSKEVLTDSDGNWVADFDNTVPPDYRWVAAQIFDNDGDASELRPEQIILFLRLRCGSTYTVQAGSLLQIRYGSWLAIGEDLAEQNAQHLTVNLVLDGEPITGVQQSVVPGSEIPCGALADAYGVFYITQVAPLSVGTHVASVTWVFDEQVTDGNDADRDGVPDLYGPGEVLTHEFTIIVR